MSAVQQTIDEYAEHLRDSGTQVAAHASIEWTERATRALEHLASSGAEFSIRDIYLLAGYPLVENAAGALLLNASKAGLIQLVRYERSPRLSRHAARIGVWRGSR